MYALCAQGKSKGSDGAGGGKSGGGKGGDNRWHTEVARNPAIMISFTRACALLVVID